MNPVDNPGAYDRLRICGKVTPGQWVWTTPPKPDNGWEVKTAKGSEGGETICNGGKPVECAGYIVLWRDEKRDCYAEWDAFKSVLAKSTKDGAAQQALDIYSPLLDDAGVTSVVLKCQPVVVPVAGKPGLSHVVLEFLQYRPAKKRIGTGKPKGSAALPKPPGVDPFAAENATIAANSAQIELLEAAP